MSLLIFCRDDEPFGMLAVADDKGGVWAQRDLLLIGVAVAGQLPLLFFFGFVLGTQLFHRLVRILALGDGFLACILFGFLLFLSVGLGLLFLFLLLVDLILARLPVEALVGLFEERNMVVELHEIKIARDVELTVVLNRIAQ